jgi:hypothetical protein
MSRSRNFRIAFVALVAAFIVGLASQAQAQGAINIRIVKGGWFIGGAGGSGTLALAGRRYPLTVGGLSAGLVFGGSVTNLAGRVYNIRRPSDINGTYSAIGAGGAVLVGPQAMRMQNSRGVVLELRGQKVGLEFSLDLSGMAIALQ